MNEVAEQRPRDAARRKTTGTDMVRAEVLARHTIGHSNRKIARDLHMGRDRVTAIVTEGQTRPDKATRIAQVTPWAYDAVEKGLKAGDSRLGLDWLKVTDLAEQHGDRYTFQGDVTLQQAFNLLPPVPAAAIPALASAPVAAVPPADASQDDGEALTVEAEPIPAAALTERAAHQPDCGCEDCRCPECHMRRNPRDNAGRIEFFDRCLCVSHPSLALQRQRSLATGSLGKPRRAPI